MSSSEADLLLARNQACLSYLFLTFTFICTMVYECGFAHLTDSQSKDFSTSLTWMQGAAGIVIFFWFNRARTGGLPVDTNVVTQTHTLPDGSKTTITTPAAHTQVISPPAGSPPSTAPTVITTPPVPPPIASAPAAPELPSKASPLSKVPTLQGKASLLLLGVFGIGGLAGCAFASGWRVIFT